MASSISFNPHVQKLLPHDVLEQYRIIPFKVRHDDSGVKLCLIALRPLSDEALFHLKTLTGIEDYEVQIVGEDVIDAYLSLFKSGSLFKAIAS